MKLRVHKLIFITAILITTFLCGYSYAAGITPADIKIGLFFNYPQRGINTAVSSFEVSSENGLRVGIYKNGKYKELFKGAPNTSITVQKDTYSKARIVLVRKGKPAVAFDEGEGAFLRIYPDPSKKVKGLPPLIKINNNSKMIYRGRLEVRRNDKSDMTVINVLPFEQYLYGVVPNEIGGASPKEALKAQAVAARTFAVSELRQYESLGFDIDTTPWTQVYKGFSSEYPASNKAVDETAGKVVTYQGKVAPVYYFSSDGGMTEDVKNVWGSNVAYLKSVKDVYELGKFPNYNWKVTLSAEDIKKTMTSKGYDLGEITGVKVTKTSASGRAIELVITGTKGNKTYTNEGCRMVFSLNSQLYTISVSQKPLKFTFTGKGWGHAVGMSQDGAIGMAKAGYTYVDILKHYLTGVQIGR